MSYWRMLQGDLSKAWWFPRSPRLTQTLSQLVEVFGCDPDPKPKEIQA